MENENSVQIEDTAVKATKKPLSRLAKIIITVIVAVVGVGGILAGILVPIALGTREFTDEEGVNPQATIRLSNGMELNFDIYESDCPNAATNFIWLASIGYFNDVILFDSQQGFVRFGGWTDAKKEDGTPVHRGDDDKNFTGKISFSEWTGTDGKVNNYDKNKFGYRLREDTAKRDLTGQVGALSFCYERSATEFTLTADESYSLTIDGDDNGATSTRQSWKVAPFGFASNSKTIENIRAIESLSRDDGTAFNHKYFRAPLDSDGLIKIKSVKVVKKYSGKWKKFDFVRYVNSGGTKKTTSWSTGSQKISGN